MSSLMKTSQNNHLRLVIRPLVIATLLLAPHQLIAATSTSLTNKVESINCGGLSSSSSTLEVSSSLCQPSGTATSGSFEVRSGYPVMAAETDPSISVTISTNTISFGSLSSGSVSTSSLNITVATTGNNGYTSTIKSDGPLKNIDNDTIPAVTDGSVTAGSEEYGMRTSGTDGQFNSSDTAITTSPQTFAQKNTSTTGETTTLTFKTAISPTTPAGTYSQAVTIITTSGY